MGDIGLHLYYWHNMTETGMAACYKSWLLETVMDALSRKIVLCSQAPEYKNGKSKQATVQLYAQEFGSCTKVLRNYDDLLQNQSVYGLIDLEK